MVIQGQVASHVVEVRSPGRMGLKHSLNKVCIAHARDQTLIIQSIECWPMNFERSGIFSQAPAVANSLDIS